ncbi:zinc-binding dehydrogenase [Spiractinospora alimapuensis]|uniref:zinc-binding dehydrogenase n=1 Tax=Spiractinospora alimapuensis TaxID=2820884 RepID=UPI001F19BECD|nr:zinc-binding dehydrogenase [Spiractinospora alimapuensis]QVQ50916.1 zinc-binding dehydrogenase [Spiractinospora alimapuensis]
MRVVRAKEFGGPEVLELTEAPDPVPASGEVVVDVAAAEVLLLDVQLRKGWGQDYFTLNPPYVPGAGVAGVVSGVGAGVDTTWIGSRVAAPLSVAGEYAGGGYAEKAVVDVDHLVPVPDNVELVESVTALSDGVMGVSRIERARIGPGDVVLITAAAGGIAVWLIPEAVRAGARVIAAAGGEAKLRAAADLGAHVTVDYTRPDWVDQVRVALAGETLAVVFDGSGGAVGEAAMRFTGAGTRYFAYGSAGGEFADIEGEARRRGVELFGFDEDFELRDQRRWRRTAFTWLSEGRITPLIGQVVPLSQAAQAHTAIEARKVVGKTVLVPDAAPPRPR